MNPTHRFLSQLVLAFCMLVTATLATPTAAQQSDDQAIVYTQEELDQLLAPIALYPDALLAQVLTASTYPLEVVQAARFVERNPRLQGEALARAAEPLGWDPSVTSLVQFPSVLAMMSDKLDWTQQLGDAFLGGAEGVMDTVQSLRAKAQSSGHLQSNAQQRVVIEERYIVIEPSRPQVVYVPYYNPLVVYGSWWWPARRPWYWVPPPIYRPPTWGRVVVTGVVWGIGIGITQSIWFDARPSWRDRHVTIINVNIRRPGYRPGVWLHNPTHRQGVAYRDVRTRDRFRPVDKSAVGQREPYRGRDDRLKLPPRPAPVTRPAPNPRPMPKPSPRPEVRPAPGPGARPAPVTRPAITRPPTVTRPAPGTPAPRPSPAIRPAPRPTVLAPDRSRDAARQQSDRGRASREGPGRDVGRSR